MFFKLFVLISIIKLNLCQTQSSTPLLILKNEINVKAMENHAFGVTLIELENEEKTNQEHSRNIANEMNKKFGKGWVCSVGTNDTGINLDYEPNHYIQFKYDETEVVLFKIQRASIIDLIIEARNAPKKIEVNTIIDIQITKTINTTVETAIKTLNDFKSIAVHIRDELKLKTGHNWVVVCEQKEGEIVIDTTIIETMIITIQDIRVIVYKEEAKNCSTDYELMVKNAMNSEPIDMEVQNKTRCDEVKKVVKTVLAGELPYCKNNYVPSQTYSDTCYAGITDHIREKLPSGKWTITVGKQAHCINYLTGFKGQNDCMFKLADIFFEIYNYE